MIEPIYRSTSFVMGEIYMFLTKRSFHQPIGSKRKEIIESDIADTTSSKEFVKNDEQDAPFFRELEKL